MKTIYFYDTNTKLFMYSDLIKQCYEWGVYTAEYVKSFFVDECQTITQEQADTIINSKG